MTGAAKSTAAVVRPIGPEDYERLAELLLECLQDRPDPPEVFLPDVLGALKDYGSAASPSFEGLFAEVGGPHGRRKGVERHPVGFALYSPVFWPADLTPGLFVKELYVQPAYRSQKLGQALMAALARIAAQRRWKRLFLGVETSNEQAVTFYERLPGVKRVAGELFAVQGDDLLDLADML